MISTPSWILIMIMVYVAQGNEYLGTPADADDVVALSLTKSGLQNMLDNAHNTPSDGGFHFLLGKVKLFGESKEENLKSVHNSASNSETQHSKKFNLLSISESLLIIRT